MIRKVRNLYAHTNDYLNFESQKVRELIAKELGQADAASSIDEFFGIAETVEANICQASGLPHQALIRQLKERG